MKPAAKNGGGEPPKIPDYELLKKIGAGSYGEVWLARSIMGMMRAVKIVHRSAFDSERPFEREFEGIQRFEPVSQMNENQLKIFHVGRRTDYFYYVMELADSANAEFKAIPSEEPADFASYSPRTLRSEIETRRRLPGEECVEIGLSLTAALAHLHRHGLVHRDIKPSNIIFVNGLPKLADIGLVAASEGTLTFVGTEGYLPPEGPGKAPADIFSLGKVLYEISTGKDRNQFPELPTSWNAVEERDAFAEFNEVIIKACAAQVEKRYATADEMHEDLHLLRAGKSLQRVRTLERRLVWWTKAGVAAVALSALIAAGYFYQYHQTRLAKRSNAQLQINNGLRILDEGDLQGSLLWFVEALQEEERYLSAAERAQHRLRIGTILEYCPRLIHVIAPDLNDGIQPAFIQHVPPAIAQTIIPAAASGKVADYGGRAVFSPDGRQMLIAGYGRVALLCDAATGKTLHRLEHREDLNGGEFTADGRRLITWLKHPMSGVLGEVQIWDTKSGQRVGEPWDQKSSRWVAISPDGSRVLTAVGREAHIINSDTREKLIAPLVQDGWVSAAQFSPKADRVLITSSRHRTNSWTQLWDVHAGAKIGTPKPGFRTTFNHDGTRMLTRIANELHLIDGLTAQVLVTIPMSKGWGYNFFSGNGQRLIATELNTGVITELNTGVIRVFETSTGQQVGSTIRQDNGPFSTDATADGSLIASSCGRHVHVWDVMSGQATTPPIPINDHSQVDLSADGRRLLVAGGQQEPLIRVWELKDSGRPFASMPHQHSVFRAAFNANGERLVTASQDGTAQIWDTTSGKPIGPALHTNHRSDYSLFTHVNSERLIHPVTTQRVISVPAALKPASVFHPVLGDKTSDRGDPIRWIHSTNRALFFAAFSPDSESVITTSYDGTARLWQTDTGRELIPPLTHKGAIFHAAFSRDGRRIVTASGDWTAQVWDGQSGGAIGPPLNHKGAVLYTEFSPDGRYVATASYDMTAQLWDARTGIKVGPALEHPNIDSGPVFTVKFSPNGEQLITASYDRSAQVWDARTGKKAAPPLFHRGFVYYAEFSPNGRQIVTASGVCQIWDANTGARATPPMRSGGTINYATFSPDGKLVVSASLDGTARVWNAATGQPLTPLLQHGDRVWHAEFSPDGRQILTASSDGTAKLWPLRSSNLSIADLRTLAQVLSGRHIDHTESLASSSPENLKQAFSKLGSSRPD